MASVKKSHYGSLTDGRGVEAYTLRNTKGTEVKVVTYGARLVSWRTMVKSYRFMDIAGHRELAALEKSARGAVIAADGKENFEKIIWDAEEVYEGVKFTHSGGDFNGSVLYSLSNDNELSVIFKTDGQRLAHKGVFSLSNVAVEVFADNYAAGAKTGQWTVRDEKPEVVMEAGMFGYDPTCPIDYYGAGLKKSVHLQSDDICLSLTGFCTGLGCKLGMESMDTSVVLFDETYAEGEWQGQTVYATKFLK